jgi:hypothetical protein
MDTQWTSDFTRGQPRLFVESRDLNRTKEEGMRLKLALCAFPAVLAALAVVASPASGLTKPTTFSLLDVTESSQTINGFDFQRLPQPGDRFAFTDGLYKWAGTKRGARVGTAEVLCTFTKVAASEHAFGATALCTGQFYVPGGSVLAHGFIRLTEGPGRFTVPVVGGTGRYADARGYLKIRDLGNGNEDKSNVEFHLT